MKKFAMLLIAFAMLAPSMGCGEKKDKDKVAPPPVAAPDKTDPVAPEADPAP